MKEFYAALCRAQSDMTAATMDMINPHFKSNYASLHSIFEAIREPFAQNGLSVSQPMDVLESGRMILITRLMHTSGDMIESKMLLPNLERPQQMGAAISYYRRYSLQSICGLPCKDDDGEEAQEAVVQQERLATHEQVMYLKRALALVPIYEENVLRKLEKNYGAPDLSLLPSNIVAAVLKCAVEEKLKLDSQSRKVPGCI